MFGDILVEDTLEKNENDNRKFLLLQGYKKPVEVTECPEEIFFCLQPSFPWVKEETTATLRLLQRFNINCIFQNNRQTRDCYDKLTKLNKAITQPKHGIYRMKVQTPSMENDCGANRSVTTLKHLLVQYK